MLTCKACSKQRYCLEYDREYPCREFKLAEETDKPKKARQKKGGLHNVGNNTALNKAKNKMIE